MSVTMKYLIPYLLTLSFALSGVNVLQAQKSFLAKGKGSDRPDGFTTFTIQGHNKEAQLISDFLWYHLNSRGGMDMVLFNKEYLSMSDLWLNEAPAPGKDTLVQPVYRSILLDVGISPEGYVYTHQHYSSANDYGWPFPLWTQAGQVEGNTAGWHFQELENVKGWAGDYLRSRKWAQYAGKEAVRAWETVNLRSKGIVDNHWELESSGASPMLISPEGVTIDAFNAPFLQLRWKRSGTHKASSTPYVEWIRESDEEFSPDRRVYFYPEKTPLSGEYYHTIMNVGRHPKWNGKIKRIRIALAPGESDVNFQVDSFFTAYDTRHTINNPIFIFASVWYFNWTYDLDFLRKNINRMRLALQYQQKVMGGLKYNNIRNTWTGHNGLPGWNSNKDGSKDLHSGHGIGSNYWDLLPFGWDDMYATSQYYAAINVMADLEEDIQDHPEWEIPTGPLAFDPENLRNHAQAVKKEANRKFWNSKTGRFNAVVDKNGNTHDYGFTFLNLEAIWYGIANEQHGQAIMDWITGERIVEGDTSTDDDIYHWRFGPRSTTRRNVDWYGWVWNGPESIPWGGQVQDGGAVLGFTFYDLWARLQILGPDNAWQRLTEIVDWLQDVNAEGGYRAYYADGEKGTTLQGCGTPGGLGIDCEFRESSMLPAIITYGFLGLDPQPGALSIDPNLPSGVPQMGMQNILYHGVPIDVTVSEDQIILKVKEKPAASIHINLSGNWYTEAGDNGSDFVIETSGNYYYKRLN